MQHLFVREIDHHHKCTYYFDIVNIFSQKKYKISIFYKKSSCGHKKNVSE